MSINRWMDKEAVYYSAIKRNAFELVLIDFWFTFGNRVKMREKFQAPDIFAKLPYLPYILLRYHLYLLNVFCYKCPSFPKSPVFQKMPLSPTPWHLLSSISTPGCSHPLKSHFFVNLCRWLLLFCRSVTPVSLRPHGLQHARLPCPSPSPGVCSNSMSI